MLKIIKQNKATILISLAVFLVSMSTLLIFLDQNKESSGHSKLNHETKASVIYSDQNSINDELNYRSILHDQNNPVLALNLDGSISLVSGQFLSKLGYVEEDLQAKSFFQLLHPDDLLIFVNAFGQVLKSETPVSTIGPYRVKTKTGEYQYHIGYATPFIEDKKVTKILIVTKSIQDKMGAKDSPEIKDAH